jgi:hypothetical protein
MDTTYYTSPRLYGPHNFPRKVVGHHHGIANDYFRSPYRLSKLECGHIQKDAEVGEVIQCQECVWYACSLFQLKAALAAGVVSHTRANRNGLDQLTGSITVYRYEPTSPTGVYSVCGIEETDEVRALLKGGLAPLSPTEPR